MDRRITDGLTARPRKDVEVELLEAEARDPDSKGLVQAVIDGLDAQVEQYGKLLHIFRGRAYALSRLKLQALDKQAVSDSERRAVATARSRVHTRINKSNGAMAAALGSEPGANELVGIRLRRLMEEDEWGGPGDKPRKARTNYNLREEADFRPVDLPSARGPQWRGLEVAGTDEDDTGLRRRAMTVQVQLVVARLDEELSQIRTRIVDQANTYLQRIRSRSGHRARGYHAANQAYADAQNQGKAVRIHAQIYNACRGMLERLKWNKEPSAAGEFDKLLERYKYLCAEDLKCSTETYSTAGTTSKFTLPWFWRMVPANVNESPEVARAKDEKFVAQCEPILYLIP